MAKRVPWRGRLHAEAGGCGHLVGLLRLGVPGDPQQAQAEHGVEHAGGVLRGLAADQVRQHVAQRCGDDLQSKDARPSSQPI